MTMATHALPTSYIADNTTAATTPAAPSLLRRLYDFIIAAQTLRAQQVIALYMQDRGLRFIDGMNEPGGDSLRSPLGR
jgi:hypothetical protein